MYRKHPKGSEVELWGGIIANVPPPGIVWDNTTNDWVETGIYSRSSKKSEQYWERMPLPAWYNKRRKEEEAFIIAEKNNDLFFDDCESYRAQEWFRRLNGFWFMNNGVPTYITGFHYFYLNWWPLDVGYPDYFNYDRKRFYHTEYCNEDPKCFGRLEVGPRRMGKTYMGGAFIYEPISRSKNANGGIQSKTNADSKKVFGKALVSQFRKQPHFFRPVYDTSSGTIPKSEIRFFNTSKKGASVSIEDMEEELESTIDFQSSGKYAYDGSKLMRVLHDEVFKTEEVDVYDRWLVVKECLVNNVTEEIVGKAFCTSTVEEITGQLNRYKEWWDDSDPQKRDLNGHTKSGLYQYFIKASETRGLDKYGNCDEDKNTKIILNTIEGLTGDSKAISDYRRKYPLSPKDAFRPTAQDCHYDSEKLNNRYDLLSVIEPKYVVGDFLWINPNDRSDGVKFVERKNGKFKLHKDIDYNDNVWNQVEQRGSKSIPRNAAKFIGATDPYDHITTVDGRKSNGSTTIFYKYDPLNPLKSDKFVCIYCFRPKKPSIFYEDTLKALWFFGAKMLFEDQKQGIRTYFDGLNCSEFLVQLPDRKEPGIPASQKAHQSIVDHTEEYISDCIELVDFPDLIEDWLQFDINNTTKFDLAMASGYNLIAANRIKPAKKVVKEKFTEISDIFPMY